MTESRTLTEAATALRTGETTAVELVERAIANTDALDASLGCFLNRYTDAARAQAITTDAAISAGRGVAPLAGIPLGIKDIIAESSGPTTGQSLVLDPAWGPSQGDAPLVQRLKEAGGVIMGKLSTMEFAIGNPDPSKPFPVPLNAWSADHWAGGSSSGSGSAVATEMVLGAIGTDTAGSVRIPSAFNGITGLKPTFGRVPKAGVVPLGYTLDHPGPMARSAADCALLLSVIAGHHPADPYASTRPAEDYVAALTGDVQGLRIGVDDLDRAADGGIDPEQPARFAAAVQVLAEAGAEIVPVQVPMYAEVTAIDLLVMFAEAHAYHRSDLRSRWQDYGQATRIVLAAGAAVTGADYVQAQRVRRLAQDQMAGLLDEVDLVVTPTSHLGATEIAAMSCLEPLGALRSLHTPYWNPLGNPTLALPIGLSSEGTPLSMSISGPHFADALVLRTGDALQRRTDHHLARTPLLAPAALAA